MSRMAETPQNESSGRDTAAKSFRRMAAVLNCFSRTRERLSIAEIAEETGLPRTTIHRITSSLREIGLIDQDGRRGDYRLGLRMFYFGSMVLANLNLNERAHHPVLQLHTLTGEIVHLHMFDGGHMVCIEREEMGELRSTTLTTIEAAPVHCTSVGKAFLAFQSEEFIRRLVASEGLEKRTHKTLATVEDLLADMSRVRERGYSTDEEENEIGVQCIGAPIRDSRGRVFASVSVSGPAPRMPVARLKGLAPMVMQTANTISRQLGWDGEASETL